MRNVIWTCLTIFFFILLTLSFGLPGKMRLIDRNSSSYVQYDVTDKSIPESMISDTPDPDLLGTLSNINSELVLLGNSMLGEAVGQQQMSRLLGIPTVKVWLGGSGSAWWYLVIKNILPQLPYKPKYIGIFFRDNYLTLPQHKTNGRHRNGIDGLAGEHEEVLDQLAYYSSMNPVELGLQRYVPLCNHRSRLKDTFERNLKQMTADVVGVEGVKKVNELIKDTFDNAKMNSLMLHEREIADERAQDAYRKDMSFHPDRCFLEHIVKLCKEQGITLFFVRVKRLRDLKPHRQSPELLKYISQLNSYLDEQNIPLIDFTDNRQIVKRHYAKSDHLNRKGGRKLFTALLAELIKDNVLAEQRILTSSLQKNGHN